MSSSLLQISVDHFQIKDIIDTAIAMNDVPFLVLSVQERWNQHFPLLSEMDILNKKLVLYCITLSNFLYHIDIS